ncbi:DoxX family protein [Micromonospora sp. CPCC 206060]|uniref:DoxX family protein n=1 Tax=Micromonospora sp. CPCC 206060 TaxID=3122406 RepID=UPI002FF08055
MSTDAVRPGHWGGDVNRDSASSSSVTARDAVAQDPWVGAGLLAVRLAIGSTFLLHGIQNLSGAWTGWDTAKMATYLGDKGFGGGARFMAWLLAFAEIGAGLAMLLGFFTAVGASLVVITMATSTSLKLSVGFFMPGGFEWELAVLAGGLVLLLAGAGQYSLDHAKLSARTRDRVRKVALAATIVITLVMVVVTWGSPPPKIG